MVVLGCFWWFRGVIKRLGCCMGGYGYIWYIMVIYGDLVYIRFALYIEVPNHMHLLLIASVHIV